MTILRRTLIALILLGFGASCAPRPATPSASDMGTAVAAAAFTLMTQTAAAASPTPSPTETPTPLPTATPTIAVTDTPEHVNPLILNFTGCYFGPGGNSTLESNISKGKRVELLGVGSEPGWYIIRNPYFHRPCWVAASDLSIDKGIDLSALPVMTPGAPLPGQ